MTRFRLVAVLAALAAAALAAPAARVSAAPRAVRAAEAPAAPVVEPAAPAAPAAETPEAAGPAGRPRAFEDLKAIYDGADLLIQFQVDATQARPEISQKLPWEVAATLVGVLRGTLGPGKIAVHVESVLRAFDLQRAEAEGKQFIAAVKPLADATQRRFYLVGGCAFLADSKEADVFRQLADTDATRGSGSEDLQLQVRLVGQVFPVQGPKPIEVLLTNLGKESATYVQQPVTERDGKLYLTGQGQIRIYDASGRPLAPKATVLAGQVPPGQPTPALILPKATFREIVDLDKHFDLSAGRYTLAVMLAPPSGRGRIASNGLSFQVGAIDLPPEPEPAKSPATPATPATLPASPATEPPAKQGPPVPDPASYEPGQTVSGLSGLLRPAKAQFAPGDPISVEFRLVNRGPRTMAVDARLERTFTVQVSPLADSPQPLIIRQIITWPADGAGRPDQRAYLREGSFWGQTFNLNVLKSRDEIVPPTPEDIAAGKDLTYERFGQTLFGFPKPGYYEVTATYKVPRPQPAQPGAAPPADWWFGELVTNKIVIQITEPRRP